MTLARHLLVTRINTLQSPPLTLREDCNGARAAVVFDKSDWPNSKGLCRLNVASKRPLTASAVVLNHTIGPRSDGSGAKRTSRFADIQCHIISRSAVLPMHGQHNVRTGPDASRWFEMPTWMTVRLIEPAGERCLQPSCRQRPGCQPASAAKRS